MRTARLRVRLREVDPPVERIVDAPATARLPELHDLLQAAMGRVDVHRHEFVTGEARYGAPDGDDLDDGLLDEARVGLPDLGPLWVYRYDSADDWVHNVEVLGRGQSTPGCVSGRGSCPPENCGGPPGYEQLRKVLSDPHHVEHLQMSSWAGGDLPEFDRDATDRRVRQAVGEVPETVRLLLGLIVDGVALTPGGRLPRRVVREMQQQRPHWSLSGKPAHLEEDLPALVALHDLLRGVGLLRRHQGTLRAIKAADDDLEVLRRTRS